MFDTMHLSIEKLEKSVANHLNRAPVLPYCRRLHSDIQNVSRHVPFFGVKEDGGFPRGESLKALAPCLLDVTAWLPAHTLHGKPGCLQRYGTTLSTWVDWQARQCPAILDILML
jgi:hypothetical protein